MLERLSEHIRDCYERAAEYALRAGRAEEPLKSDYHSMARGWTHLARSYEFAESLERFLVEAAHGRGRGEPPPKAAWQAAANAPYDRNLRLAVIDGTGEAHALIFPCRRILGGWIRAETKDRVQIDPTHWQEWTAE